MTTNTLIVVATVAVLFLTLSSTSAATCNKQDEKALFAFKRAFPHNPLLDWRIGIDCCSWPYVGCDSTGRVTSLTISGISDDPPAMLLNGSIPASIGDLSALQKIDFEYMPALVGPIPTQLSKLKKLQTLLIADCGLTGSIPSFLSQLPSLVQINLADNKLVGNIPPSLGNLSSLTDLRLYGNQLTGPIPSTLFGRLSSQGKAFLYLSKNKLTGTIPHSLGNVNFFAVYLDNNQLTGDASFLFGKSKTVTSIILSFNKLAFDLTNVDYPMALTSLDLRQNEIYGSISNQITEVPNLDSFDVSYNKLCGKIPSGGHFKTFAVEFYTHNKCLCGTPLPPCK